MIKIDQTQIIGWWRPVLWLVTPTLDDFDPLTLLPGSPVTRRPGQPGPQQHQPPPHQPPQGNGAPISGHLMRKWYSKPLKYGVPMGTPYLDTPKCSLDSDVSSVVSLTPWLLCVLLWLNLIVPSLNFIFGNLLLYTSPKSPNSRSGVSWEDRPAARVEHKTKLPHRSVQQPKQPRGLAEAEQERIARHFHIRGAQCWPVPAGRGGWEKWAANEQQMSSKWAANEQQMSSIEHLQKFWRTQKHLRLQLFGGWLCLVVEQIFWKVHQKAARILHRRQRQVTILCKACPNFS